ncbi:hypothetical protein [Oceanicoccus sp. KOV_DT_Chl]|uniref:hypothetical protein n=1 Tax=Oceanicoccus sp. KOV_DT_Chl TaxID=1904639 RepID=UPI000C7CF4E1|nr:hypothetical protein [Oceanicoccus sp. KOV_DT_Chl]
MAGDNRDEDTPKEQTLEDKIEVVAVKASKQFWIAIACIPVILIIFVVGIITLANAHKQTSSIVAEKPVNKLEMFSRNIEGVKQKAEKQYANYLDKMEDKSILTINENFRVMYQLSGESEQDYTQLLDVYQKVNYENASRIRGSGQWFFYHEKKIKNLILRSQQREEKLMAYLQAD